jgi:uncharacterized protein (TIGR03118 family)
MFMRVPSIFHSLRFATCAGIALLSIGSGQAQHYTQTNLVSDGAIPAAHTDPNLKNAWGLSRSSTSPWWVADNATAVATLYDGTGTPPALVVSVPGAPTGTIYNGSQDFQIEQGFPARFLFASEDGTISGWNSQVDATHARVVVTTPNAIYKGMTSAEVDGKQYLYAADFHSGRVDVFDASFQPVHFSGYAFDFGWLQRIGLAPFNVQNIGNDIFIAFAKQDAQKEDEVAGEGLGLVAAFTSKGRLVRVFEPGRFLNAPWGLVLAPSDFGTFSHSLLVGNFGSGEIDAFNMLTGKFQGKLVDPDGNIIKIDGLWGISFGNGATAGPFNTLYFASGPNGETNGLFGSLTAVASEQIRGNAQ